MPWSFQIVNRCVPYLFATFFSPGMDQGLGLASNGEASCRNPSTRVYGAGSRRSLPSSCPTDKDMYAVSLPAFPLLDTAVPDIVLGLGIEYGCNHFHCLVNTSVNSKSSITKTLMSKTSYQIENVLQLTLLFLP